MRKEVKLVREGQGLKSLAVKLHIDVLFVHCTVNNALIAVKFLSKFCSWNFATEHMHEYSSAFSS